MRDIPWMPFEATLSRRKWIDVDIHGQQEDFTCEVCYSARDFCGLERVENVDGLDDVVSILRDLT
jgi:hypothetical protein